MGRTPLELLALVLLLDDEDDELLVEDALLVDEDVLAMPDDVLVLAMPDDVLVLAMPDEVLVLVLELEVELEPAEPDAELPFEPDDPTTGGLLGSAASGSTSILPRDSAMTAGAHAVPAVRGVAGFEATVSELGRSTHVW